MIQRDSYLEEIKPFIGKNIIKVLVGVRRAGKSTLLEMLAQHFVDSGTDPSTLLHLRFESEEYAHINNKDDLVRYVYESLDTSKPFILLLDEIQEVEGWEVALRSFMVDCTADIYITGSNAHVLSSDLATYITGRYVTIPIYPLSFAEFYDGLQAVTGQVDSRSAFRKYVLQGGFPFQNELAFEQSASLKYLSDLLSTILLKDVVRRNSIRDVDLLERLVRYAAAEEGHLLSVKNIADYLKSERRKAAQETIANYLYAAENAYLFYRIPREDALGKSILAFNEKWYLVDPGLRQALGLDNASHIDQVLEGIVCMELKRRGYELTVGKIGHQEIDFIAKKGSSIEYYQVSYLVVDEATRNREFGALEALPDNYPKYVLSLDEFQTSRNGIEGKNLIDWLLAGAD
ncbi:MAG: ATP-binding protein [Eggerthellaceae bacterium]